MYLKGHSYLTAKGSGQKHTVCSPTIMIDFHGFLIYSRKCIRQ